MYMEPIYPRLRVEISVRYVHHEPKVHQFGNKQEIFAEMFIKELTH